MSLTLTQVRECDTEHLSSAAQHWSAAATRWEDAFAQLERATHMPGGSPWEGAAARAAQARSHADRRLLSAAAEQLYTASVIASRAVGELQAAQRRVLDVVGAAEAAGFIVGEDFSLTTYRAGAREIASAEAEAREFGRQLRDRIERLIDLEKQIADRLTTASGGVGILAFAETHEGGPDRDETVHLVDNRVVKEAPPQPPPPDPTPGPL